MVSLPTGNPWLALPTTLAATTHLWLPVLVTGTAVKFQNKMQLYYDIGKTKSPGRRQSNPSK